MHNWGVDVRTLKRDKKQFAKWKIEQMINFGTDGERLSRVALKKFWRELALDPAKRRFLGFLLWGKKYLDRTK